LISENKAKVGLEDQISNNYKKIT